MKLERKNIYITKPQSEQLMQYHKQTGLGYSEIFRRALDEYLEGRLKNVPYNSDKSRK